MFVNSYVLSLLVGFGIGVLLVTVPALFHREKSRKGFDSPQRMISSEVDGIKDAGHFRAADEYNE